MFNSRFHAYHKHLYKILVKMYKGLNSRWNFWKNLLIKNGKSAMLFAKCTTGVNKQLQ